ncbi:hypothetical protein SO802_026676 [Lithocarpus litseifolius]|uniref:Uncharacterized protein n=1 Tax=Lithocarpus litseifolius TaxID=425828 RepID=A0AAW2C224_9ROSI
MASSQGKKRVTQGKESEQSLISRASRNVSQSSIVIHAKRAASEAAVVSKKLLRSTGKAAWIAGTTFLILAVPLIIEMDRDQQLTEIELQNASLLGTTPTPNAHESVEFRLRADSPINPIILDLRKFQLMLIEEIQVIDQFLKLMSMI